MPSELCRLLPFQTNDSRCTYIRGNCSNHTCRCSLLHVYKKVNCTRQMSLFRYLCIFSCNACYSMCLLCYRQLSRVAPESQKSFREWTATQFTVFSMKLIQAPFAPWSIRVHVPVWWLVCTKRTVPMRCLLREVRPLGHICKCLLDMRPWHGFNYSACPSEVPRSDSDGKEVIFYSILHQVC